MGNDQRNSSSGRVTLPPHPDAAPLSSRSYQALENMHGYNTLSTVDKARVDHHIINHLPGLREILVDNGINAHLAMKEDKQALKGDDPTLLQNIKAHLGSTWRNHSGVDMERYVESQRNQFAQQFDTIPPLEDTLIIGDQFAAIQTADWLAQQSHNFTNRLQKYAFRTTEKNIDTRIDIFLSEIEDYYFEKASSPELQNCVLLARSKYSLTPPFAQPEALGSDLSKILDALPDYSAEKQDEVTWQYLPACVERSESSPER